MSLVSWPLSATPSIRPAMLKSGSRQLWSVIWIDTVGTAVFLRSEVSLCPGKLAENVSRVPLEVPKCSARPFEESEDKKTSELAEDEDDGDGDEEMLGWSKVEIDAISALFDRLMPQKPGKPVKERALPLPLPHKTRMPSSPTPKRHVRLAARSALSSRSSFSGRVHKNPEALIGIAREIGALPPESNASVILDRWAHFLRKGSLSLTIRELGHMGLPKRALQTLCWAQKQKALALFPDDQILSSAVEVLARFGQLEVETELANCVASASRPVLEAMASGFIRAGQLNLARKILVLAKQNRRTLDPSIHAKLMLEAARTPNGYRLASVLLDELSQREDFDLKLQDCTAVMKVCIKLGRFEAVESLFNWFRESGRHPSVVMYTTVLHSRYCGKKYREGLALVWEMEGSNCLLDLPAYRVVIRLCVALNDLARASRYFSRLKEAGFVPTYDIYCDMVKAYAMSGRLAKCRQLFAEAELIGLKLDRKMISQFTGI